MLSRHPEDGRLLCPHRIAAGNLDETIRYDVMAHMKQIAGMAARKDVQYTKEDLVNLRSLLQGRLTTHVTLNQNGTFYHNGYSKEERDMADCDWWSPEFNGIVAEATAFTVLPHPFTPSVEATDPISRFNVTKSGKKTTAVHAPASTDVVAYHTNIMKGLNPPHVMALFRAAAILQDEVQQAESEGPLRKPQKQEYGIRRKAIIDGLNNCYIIARIPPYMFKNRVGRKIINQANFDKMVAMFKS